MTNTTTIKSKNTKKLYIFFSKTIFGDNSQTQLALILHTVMLVFFLQFVFMSHCFAADTGQKNLNSNINWTNWGGDLQGTRYSELDQINSSNVDQLELSSTIPLGAEGNYIGGALIVDGLIYLQEPNADTLYAYNQLTGKLQWSRQGGELTIGGINPSSVKGAELSSLGLAYSEGVIYWYQLSGSLLALNAHTGETLWQKKNTTEQNLIGGTPPIVVGKKVIIGVSDLRTNSEADSGYITAYDTQTGDMEWRAYSYGTPEEVRYDPNRLISNGKSHNNNVPFDTTLLTNPLRDENIGGGVPSGWISFDPESNLIFYGTTSNLPQYQVTSKWPDYNRNYIYSWRPSLLSSRPFFKYAAPFQTLWTSALWARDADSGELVWIYQMTPNNLWGYDGINESILVDLAIAGNNVKVLVHVDHNGYTFVLDRLSGQLISTTKVDDIVNWSTGSKSEQGSNQPQATHTLIDKVDKDGGSQYESYCPSMLGAKPLQPAAFSKQTGFIYIAGNRRCMILAAQNITREQGKIALYGMSSVRNYYHYSENIYEPGHGGFLRAWDPQTNEYKWMLPETYAINSGVLTTKGGVTFYATLDGYFRAVDSETGINLYNFKMPMKALGNISTWMYQGKQYVGVLIGANPNVDHAWIYHCGNERTDGYRSPGKWEYEVENGKQLCGKPDGGAYFIFSLDKS